MASDYDTFVAAKKAIVGKDPEALKKTLEANKDYDINYTFSKDSSLLYQVLLQLQDEYIEHRKKEEKVPYKENQKLMDMLQLLLDKGAKVDKRLELDRDDDQTALHYARTPAIAKLLLSKYKDDAERRKVVDETGALTGWGNQDTRLYYITLGADVTRKQYGRNWLAEYVRFYQGEETIKTLFDAMSKEQKAALYKADFVNDMLSGHFSENGRLYGSDTILHLLNEMPKEARNWPLTDPNSGGLITPLSWLKGNLEYLGYIRGLEDRAADWSKDLLRQQRPTRKLYEAFSTSGAKTTDELLADTAGSYKSAAEFIEKRLGTVIGGRWDSKPQLIEIKAPDKDDFAALPVLAERKAYGPRVLLAVVEDDVLFSDRKDGLAHVKRTSHVASSAEKMLGSKDGLEVVAVHYPSRKKMQFLPLEQNLITFAKARKTEVIFSISMGQAEFLGFVPYDDQSDTKAPAARGATVYHAIGNDGRASKEGVRPKNVQDHGFLAQSVGTINVGATHDPEKEGEPRVLAEYSEPGAKFLGPQLKYEGKRLRGTSFTTPLLAATDAVLTRRYGEWEENPYGLTAEERQLVLMMTTRKDAIDPYTKKPLVYDKRGDGIGYSQYGGFGEIDIKAADELANRLFEYKKKNRIKTVYTGQTLPIDVPKEEQKPDKEGKYRYTVTLTEPLVVGNTVVAVKMKQEKEEGRTAPKNHEQLRYGYIIYGDTTIPINFSGGGQSVVPGLAGMQLPKGAKITLVTEAPVLSGSITLTGTDGTKPSPVLAFLREEMKLDKKEEKKEEKEKPPAKEEEAMFRLMRERVDRLALTFGTPAVPAEEPKDPKGKPVRLDDAGLAAVNLVKTGLEGMVKPGTGQSALVLPYKKSTPTLEA